jgi:hypothetical protein
MRALLPSIEIPLATSLLMPVRVLHMIFFIADCTVTSHKYPDNLVEVGGLLSLRSSDYADAERLRISVMTWFIQHWNVAVFDLRGQTFVHPATHFGAMTLDILLEMLCISSDAPES